MVQLLTIVCNHWEDHSLDYTTFVSRVMSLLFTTLSRFVTAFLSRSNHLLISWLQSPPAVILESKKRKSVTISTFSPSTCHEVMETLVRFLGQEDPLEKGQATHSIILGLPWWLRRFRIHLQCGRPGLDPWVGKIPWRRERLPTPVFRPGEFHGLHSQSTGWQRVGHD